MTTDGTGRPKHYILDIETTPIDKTDRRKLPGTIHCIVLADAFTGEIWQYGPGQLAMAQLIVSQADRLIGHDLARFDLPVLEQHWPMKDWKGEIFDTHAVSRLVYASNIKERSILFRNRAGRDDAAREAKLPFKLIGAHKLEAWGYRLNIPKQHADVDLSFFHQWSAELQERCVSDVKITLALYRHLLERSADPELRFPVCSLDSMLNESRVAYIVGQQERNGVGFDRGAASTLLGVLSEERAHLERKLRSAVAPWLAPRGNPVNPARDRIMRKGKPWPVTYTQGAEYQPIERVEFAPGSTLHRWLVLEGRAERQRRLRKSDPVYGPIGYGWRATEFTETGQAIVDEDTLAGLPYPIIPDLLRYLTVAKRLGQLSEGNQAWLKHEHNGRIHGGVLPTGTRTSRAAHFSPNLGQVPKCSSLYGPECRALFKPTRPGWVQVGVDAQGLELRMLAHRLYPYDNGAFAKVVLEGDPHALWMKATGIFLRDYQKNWTYAKLYGAGNQKLGELMLADWREAQRRGITTKPVPDQKYAEALGKASQARLLHNFTALDRLLHECHENNKQGWFSALDGRILACPNQHGALNDLLQSDGAILVKHAMPIWHASLREWGAKLGEHWAPMLWVHDEWQLECLPELAEDIGKIVCEAIRIAGERLGVKCKMEGEYKVGANWKETH